MSNPPQARLLDLSRLVSRAGKMPTGIDRVELAYLSAVIEDSVPSFGLARTALGYVLLNEDGLQRFHEAYRAKNWPRADFVSRLNPRLTDAARIGQSLARANAFARASRQGLTRMLTKRLPPDLVYLNVGHANLTRQTLSAIRQHGRARIGIMVHDVIPLDYSEYQRPGTVEEFRGKLRRVSEFADTVICVTKAESQNVARRLTSFGRLPEVCVAQIGVDAAKPMKGTEDLIEEPYFMTVGTIEPRKNHALLLDVWEALGDAAPKLLICGSRGWNNDDVFARLNNAPANVIERSDLSDEAVRALYRRTSGVLFPSFAEGFGLPPVEAAAHGATVMCSDLPSCREVLGTFPVYLDPTDRYQWEKAVRTKMEAVTSREEQPFDPPSWAAHFKAVFTTL